MPAPNGLGRRFQFTTMTSEYIIPVLVHGWLVRLDVSQRFDPNKQEANLKAHGHDEESMLVPGILLLFPEC